MVNGGDLKCVYAFVLQICVILLVKLFTKYEQNRYDSKHLFYTIWEENVLLLLFICYIEKF